MARVFLPECYRDNKIPTADDFRFLRREISERLIASSIGVHGVVLFGSVERGDFNCTSDFDLVVMVESLDDYNFRGVMKLSHGISLYAEARYLPFRPIFLGLEQGRSGMHSFSRSFIDHLRTAEGKGLIFGKPITSQLRESKILPSVEAMPYALHKMDVVLKGIVSMSTSNPEHYCRTLENVLQVPVYYARKYLWDCGKLGQSDSKSEVVRSFLENGPRALIEPFEKLLELQNKYMEVVEDPSRNLHKYWAVLRELEDGLETLVSFLNMALNLRHR
jgi:hypothetical protein